MRQCYSIPGLHCLFLGHHSERHWLLFIILIGSCGFKGTAFRMILSKGLQIWSSWYRSIINFHFSGKRCFRSSRNSSSLSDGMLLNIDSTLRICPFGAWNRLRRTEDMLRLLILICKLRDIGSIGILHGGITFIH